MIVGIGNVEIALGVEFETGGPIQRRLQRGLAIARKTGYAGAGHRGNRAAGQVDGTNPVIQFVGDIEAASGARQEIARVVEHSLDRRPPVAAETGRAGASRAFGRR